MYTSKMLRHFQDTKVIENRVTFYLFLGKESETNMIQTCKQKWAGKPKAIIMCNTINKLCWKAPFLVTFLFSNWAQDQRAHVLWNKYLPHYKFIVIINGCLWRVHTRILVKENKTNIQDVYVNNTPKVWETAPCTIVFPTCDECKSVMLSDLFI